MQKSSGATIMPGYNYLVFDDVRVSEFNAMSNPYIIGAPSPTSYVGLGYAFQRYLCGKERFSPNFSLPISIRGTCVIIKSCDIDEGRPLYPAQFNVRSDKNAAMTGNAPPMVEEVKGHGRLAIIFAFSFDPDTDIEDIEDSFDELGSDKTRNDMMRFRISGGTIYSVSHPQCVEDDNEFLSVLSRIPGSALIDRADLLQPEEEDERDHLDRLLDALAFQQHKTSNHVINKRQQPGWIVPYAAGYKALEQPKSRQYAVKNKQHAYVEPLLGLGEYVTTKRLAADREKALSAFWRYQHTGSIYNVRPLLQDASF